MHEKVAAQRASDTAVAPGGDVEVRRRFAGALTPTGVAALQRTAGNQAVGRLLQRKAVTPGAYLDGIVQSDGGDAEWDPQWTIALGRVKREDLRALGNQIDDESLEDAQRLVAVLKTLATLSNDKPNPYRMAVDAVRWHAGIESDSGGSGFGSLDTSAPPITGRPAFPAFTQANLPLRAGQHRRHIVAWHTLREFVERAYAAQPKVVTQTIWRAFYAEKMDKAVEQAFAEAVQHVTSGREKTKAGKDVLSDEELLKVGLFVMNGNPRNLWPGKGSTNSAINTAQMHMNAALSKITTFAEMPVQVETWRKASGKQIYKTATTLGADMLEQRGTEAMSEWEATKDKAREPEFVARVTKTVSDYVISNLETDVLGDSKEQNEMVQAKAKELNDPRQIIENVMNGAVDITKLYPGLLGMVLKEFLTYLKP